MHACIRSVSCTLYEAYIKINLPHMDASMAYESLLQVIEAEVSLALALFSAAVVHFSS
jgi:hypothetical protein